MNVILDNYLIIIIVGLFFVFALIGYLIDMLRKDKKEDYNEIQENKLIVEEKPQIEASLDKDDLLKSYEDAKEE